MPIHCIEGMNGRMVTSSTARLTGVRLPDVLDGFAAAVGEEGRGHARGHS